MAIKGLCKPVFGNYQHSGNVVTYTNGFVAGAAVEYGAEIETSDDNPLYGDNKIIEHDYGTFSTGTLTLNTSDLDQATSKALLGIKEVQREVGGKQVTELVYDDDTKASPKGFGIIEFHQINDVDRYRAVILCKVTPKNPAEAATTKGESIEWQTKELECSIERSDEVSENYKHPWKYEAWFDTEEEATEYLKTILNAVESLEVKSEAGSSSGKTKITVTPAIGKGNSYRYSKTGPAPSYLQDLTGWTEWDGTEEIEADSNSTLYIAEVNGQEKAVKAGSVKVTANGGV